MPKLLVFGRNGQLAKSIYNNCLANTFFESKQFVSWEQFINNEIPHICSKTVVINTFANTNVEFAETSPRHVIETHLILHERLLEVSSLAEKYVYISSTGVYGASKREPHTDIDAPTPQTVHHMTKFLAEKQCVEYFGDRVLVARTGWLFSNLKTRKNFVYARMQDIASAKNNNEQLNVYQNQFGNPTFAPDVVVALISLISKSASGTLNVVNPEPVSRAEYIREIALLVDADDYVNVLPVSERPIRKALVSDNEMALCTRLKDEFYITLPDWRIGLRLAVKGLSNESKSV